MENKTFFKNIFNAFFDGATPTEMLMRCPNHMLWEAIKREDAVIVEKQEILAYLLLKDAFWIMTDPIRTIQYGEELECIRMKCSDLLADSKENFLDFIKQEPTYLVSCDYKWMIALTTENTPHGTQLCAVVSNRGTESCPAQ